MRRGQQTSAHQAGIERPGGPGGGCNQRWGRGIAVELGAAGATVYVTGRSSAAGCSDLDWPETIEETAERVTAAGGVGIEITDGNTARYRGSFFYDLAKSQVIRLAVAQAAELQPHNVAAVALTAGFMRSEAVLDHFGGTGANWRDGIAKDPHFVASETPAYLGRAVVALAADPTVMNKTLATWDLAKEYGFADIDGTQPDFAAHWAEALTEEHGPLGQPL